MPLALHGIGVSRGCAIGETYHLLRDQPEVLEYAIPQDMVDDEVRRFEEAITEARRELEDIRSRVAPNVPAEVTSFIDAHLLMLEDPALADAQRGKPVIPGGGRTVRLFQVDESMRKQVFRTGRGRVPREIRRRADRIDLF